MLQNSWLRTQDRCCQGACPSSSRAEPHLLRPPAENEYCLAQGSRPVDICEGCAPAQSRKPGRSCCRRPGLAVGSSCIFSSGLCVPPEFIQHLLGMFEVVGVEALFELAKGLRQRLMRKFNFASSCEQWAEPEVGSQLERDCFLLARYRNRLVQASFCSAVVRIALLHASPQQLAFPAPAVGLVGAVSRVGNNRQSLIDCRQRFLIRTAACKSRSQCLLKLGNHQLGA